MSGLNEAIQFIRLGRKDEARKLLEPLIRTEPANIQAWFWYVETCSTTEQRIQVLEVCLKKNPDNSQAIQALQILKSQYPAPPPVQPPVQWSKPVVEQPTAPPPSSYSVPYEESPKYASYAYQDEDPAPVQPLPVEKQKPTWEAATGAHDYVDTSMLSKSKHVARSYTFYDAWMTVLFSTDIKSYEDVLEDPEAGAGRAFEWIVYAGFVSALVFPLSILINPEITTLKEMAEFKQIFGNSGSNTFFLILSLALLVLAPIFSAIGLAINAAIYNFLSVAFGGIGNYSRTIYALAAYMAPVGMLSSILILIPVVGQCLGSVLGIYNFILTVRALRAAHSLSVGAAIGVMFAPGIIVMIFGCLLVLVVGLPSMGN